MGDLCGLFELGTAELGLVLLERLAFGLRH